MKKGFTLLGLLAVITIMAIVALIVTPFLLDAEIIKIKEYDKVVCNINGETKQIYIDTILRNTDTVITFKSGGKKYEFSKNVCYLVKE